MGTPMKRSSNLGRRNDTMRLFVTTFIGVVFGFSLGVTFRKVSLSKLPFPTNLIPSIDLPDMESRASQLKWYTKRFLHPDIVAPYDYIFIWDEDLGLENFNAEEYIKLVRKHGLDISQPGLEPNSGLTWQMTKGKNDTEVHKETEERPGWCADPHLPPCAAFVEIMAPVFSREAWRCVWHMIQVSIIKDLGLDFALRRCVEPAHEKIGVVDAQWIVHQTVPSLGSQGKAENGKAPWKWVRERCRREWTMFQDRVATAEMAYYKAMGIDPPNSTANLVDTHVYNFGLFVCKWFHKYG
ncbi:unnamed protein product [Withania somnifera]